MQTFDPRNYRQFLFHPCLLPKKQPAGLNRSSGPLKAKLKLDHYSINDWNAAAFWGTICEYFNQFPEETFMLVICAQFVRDKVYEDATPAM